MVVVVERDGGGGTRWALRDVASWWSFHVTVVS